MTHLVIGSRGSKLALQQSRSVAKTLEERNPGVQVSVEIIKTTGDKMSRTALSQLAGSRKGLFVKEIEEALLKGRVHLAVHSLKDLPTELPQGLELVAVPLRQDPRDALVANSPEVDSLETLPPNGSLGTGSLRRQVQLHMLRPDLSVSSIRGNVDTRIRKIQERGLDGIVLAVAGLKRMGLEGKISYILSVEEMVPAVGQGALGLEIRSDNQAVREIVQGLDHQPTHLCTAAERCFLANMGGGCQVPMGAHAWMENGTAFFTAFVGSPSSRRTLRKTCQGSPQELESMALETSRYLLDQGAKGMLQESS